VVCLRLTKTYTTRKTKELTSEVDKSNILSRTRKGGGGSVAYRDMDSDWNLDSFHSIIITTDYNHTEQFLQHSTPRVHWQLNWNSPAANWTDPSSWSKHRARLVRLLNTNSICLLWVDSHYSLELLFTFLISHLIWSDLILLHSLLFPCFCGPQGDQRFSILDTRL
jgi:hypothetical protein